MKGKARESFLALVSETLAEPGVGYARLHAPDGVTGSNRTTPSRRPSS